MAFKFNNQTPARITYNGNSVSRVKYGDTTVWVAFTSQEFTYKGSVESFTAPVAGTYELEVWGAQGDKGNTNRGSYDGGLGGYSYGRVTLTEGQTIYICCGKGSNIKNNEANYNGGGGVTKTKEGHEGGAGGGATHIATESRGNGELYNYENHTNELLIVAGGGGGGGIQGKGGTGGGSEGGTGRVAGDSKENPDGARGGTQVGGNAFGQGASTNSNIESGGGGGFYGGYYGNNVNGAAGGGGGSGYIGGVTNANTQNGINTGNGKAKITLKLD